MKIPNIANTVLINLIVAIGSNSKVQVQYKLMKLGTNATTTRNGWCRGESG